MAVAQLVDSRMRLILDDGVDEVSGKQLYKTKGFNNVKTDATADQLYAIANAVAPLQQRPLLEVERNDSSNITQA
ncbi:DUF1659 domain-containing protein [Lentibacillus cibarius]|uniref:DUF1659 domain-containing protein n=1 Tax=Lentibacillus cibarius TaxID=2583219 RepID=A0A549YFH1_9BACI|nr:DUF1659 domain-containing protein [Lentibacillus cibarius]TMN21765.1 DUF1659 domain-containing protein [Lentibacillus cibarius]TRM10626.1 DUF1659 domain-containing protein [Lentibacillus cibarius]